MVLPHFILDIFTFDILFVFQIKLIVLFGQKIKFETQSDIQTIKNQRNENYSIPIFLLEPDFQCKTISLTTCYKIYKFSNLYQNIFDIAPVKIKITKKTNTYIFILVQSTTTWYLLCDLSYPNSENLGFRDVSFRTGGPTRYQRHILSSHPQHHFSYVISIFFDSLHILLLLMFHLICDYIQAPPLMICSRCLISMARLLISSFLVTAGIYICTIMFF